MRRNAGDREMALTKPSVLAVPTDASPDDVAREADAIAAAHIRWLDEAFRPAIAATGERRRFELDCGIAVEPLYTPASLTERGFDYLRDAGFPGMYPFTR